MARKPKNEVIRFRCTKLLKRRIEKVADGRDTTASEIARLALLEKLEREEKALGLPESAAVA